VHRRGRKEARFLQSFSLARWVPPVNETLFQSVPTVVFLYEAGEDIIVSMSGGELGAAMKSRFFAPLRFAQNDINRQNVILSAAKDLLFFAAR
jgi:hypothetical protein